MEPSGLGPDAAIALVWLLSVNIAVYLFSFTELKLL